MKHGQPGILEAAGVRELIRRVVEEDVGSGDVTSRSLVPAETRARAVILSRGRYVVSGVEVATEVFRIVDPAVQVEVLRPDGEDVERDDVILRLNGPARAILTGERTALNFMQRMMGVASLTREFVQRTEPYGTRILDTRKTTPGLRVLEKYAVRCGGGTNHRFGLYDMALIKDNHRHLWRREAGEDLGAAVREVRRQAPGVAVEIEVESVAELESALGGAPDWVLLDNMSPEELKRCVQVCAGRCRLEASGGITLNTVERVAASGVDAISLGCLTHSAPAADLSLEMSDA